MKHIPLVLENDPIHVIGFISFTDKVAGRYIQKAIVNKTQFSVGGGFIKTKKGYKTNFLSFNK